MLLSPIAIVIRKRLPKRPSDASGPLAWNKVQLGLSHWKGYNVTGQTYDIDKVHINAKIFNPGAIGIVYFCIYGIFLYFF